MLSSYLVFSETFHRRKPFIEKVGLFSQSLPSLGLCAGLVFIVVVVVGAGLSLAQYGLPAIAPSEKPPAHQLASLLVSISAPLIRWVV